jgi:hypothetical protein
MMGGSAEPYHCPPVDGACRVARRRHQPRRRLDTRRHLGLGTTCGIPEGPRPKPRVRVQLAGAINVPAAAGQTGWRRLRPRWPVIIGVVVIALTAAGIGMAAAAITSPDPQSGSGPVRESDLQPVPGTVPRTTAPDTVGSPPASVTALAHPGGEGEAGTPLTIVALPAEDGRRRRPPAGPALSS